MSNVERLEVLPLVELRFDGETQCREKLDEDHVSDLLALFNEENPVWPRDLPPVKGCIDDVGSVWIWDGFHSCAAAQRAGCVHIPVMVRNGSKLDAQWLACSANKEHKALKRKPGDIARAVRLAWTLRPDSTSRQIAEHVGCNQSTASRENPNRPCKQKTTSHVAFDAMHQKIHSQSQIHVPEWAYEEETVTMGTTGDTGEEQRGSAGTEPGSCCAEGECPGHPANTGAGWEDGRGISDRLGHEAADSPAPPDCLVDGAGLKILSAAPVGVVGWTAFFDVSVEVNLGEEALELVREDVSG